MEAVMMHGSLDQSISSYKSRLKNQKIVRQSSNISNPGHFNSAGLLQPPPPPFLYQSYPPHTHQKSQPPLLPLPTAVPLRSVAANKKTSNHNRTRDSSLTPKKSKSPKKVEKNLPRKPAPVIIESDARKFNNGSSLSSSQMDMFSGSAAFTISPPPSSLPLPTFSLRPKLGCKAEAAGGIDAGATDDLRRLLRLR